MSNDIDEKLFEQIFGHTLIKLADKLINTTNKEENQITVKNIGKSKDKHFEMKDYSNEWVIQPNNQHINLINTIKSILKLNEEFNYENENENEDNENENKDNEKEKENEKLRKENENKNSKKENENEKEENEKLKKEYENEKNEKKRNNKNIK